MDDDDTNTVSIAQTPLIDVEKFVSVDGGNTYYDADSPQGPLLLEGTDPLFKFQVTNTGNVTLHNVNVSDSDFDLTAFNSIGTLAPGELQEFVFSSASWQRGQHTNTATANGDHVLGQVSDADDANYYGVLGNQPSLELEILDIYRQDPDTIVKQLQIQDASGDPTDVFITSLGTSFEWKGTKDKGRWTDFGDAKNGSEDWTTTWYLDNGDDTFDPQSDLLLGQIDNNDTAPLATQFQVPTGGEVDVWIVTDFTGITPPSFRETDYVELFNRDDMIFSTSATDDDFGL